MYYRPGIWPGKDVSKVQVLQTKCKYNYKYKYTFY